jgi:hypothetical protein
MMNPHQGNAGTRWRLWRLSIPAASLCRAEPDNCALYASDAARVRLAISAIHVQRPRAWICGEVDR